MALQEEFIWEGTSSQILNFKPFSLSLLMIILSIGGGLFLTPFFFGLLPFIIVFMVIHYLNINSQKFKLSNQRLIMESGIFNKTTDEVELYRIKDNRLEQPLLFRWLGLGNIILMTSEQLNHDVIIRAIPDAVNLKESIRLLVEARRTSKCVREIDTNDHFS